MKRRVAFLIAMLTALLMVTGCSGNNSNSGESSENQQTQQEETEVYELASDVAEDGKSMTISADNAAEGDFVMGGSLIIAENEKVVCRPELSKGGLTIELIRESDMGLDEDSSTEEIKDATKAAAAYTLKAAGSEPAEITPEPGSYYARVSAEKGTTGTAAASVEPVQ